MQSHHARQTWVQNLFVPSLDESEWIDFSEVGRLKDFQPPSSGGAPLSVNSWSFAQFYLLSETGISMVNIYISVGLRNQSWLQLRRSRTSAGQGTAAFSATSNEFCVQHNAAPTEAKDTAWWPSSTCTAVTDQRNPRIQALLALNFMTAFIFKSLGWVYPCWVFLEYEGTSALRHPKINEKSSKAYLFHSSFESTCLLGKAEAKLCLGGWDFYLSSSNAAIRRSHVITFQPLHLKLLHK